MVCGPETVATNRRCHSMAESKPLNQRIRSRMSGRFRCLAVQEDFWYDVQISREFQADYLAALIKKVMVGREGKALKIHSR